MVTVVIPEDILTLFHLCPRDIATEKVIFMSHGCLKTCGKNPGTLKKVNSILSLYQLDCIM